MSKTKGLSKKKKLLKTLMYKCLPFKVLLIVFLYAVIGFINIPINKWLSFNWQKWSDGEYHPFFGAFFVLPFSELLSCLIVFAVICAVYYFVSGIIAYRNYCYIPLTENEIRKKGFRNADEYFAYVCDMCSYGFKNNKDYILIGDEKNRKMLTTCLQVFPDNGTIFGINRHMVRNIIWNPDFLSALALASDQRAEIINGRVVLSGTTKDGDRKEYKI